MKTYTRNGITVLIGLGLAAFTIDGRTVASARFRRHEWGLTIKGHLWAVTPNMAIARFNVIPGDKITRTPVKRFKSWQACCDEIVAILASRETVEPTNTPMFFSAAKKTLLLILDQQRNNITDDFVRQPRQNAL